MSDSRLSTTPNEEYVEIEYIGTQTGWFSIRGRPSGETYQFAQTPDGRVQRVRKVDKEYFVQHIWYRVWEGESQDECGERDRQQRGSGKGLEERSTVDAPAGLQPQADVLLVTVAEVETRTVLDTVKEQYDVGCQSLHGRKNTYRDLGVIGGARILMVCSEMGFSGPGGAMLTVADAIRELHPSTVILLGIAFGVDPDKQQIGDVLVSQQILDYSPKRVGTGDEGEVVDTPRGNRVPASIRPLTRFRDSRYDWNEAHIRFGPILSGPDLVDNVEHREKLRKLQPEAIGGEMEGAGLYAAALRENVDWIVVKAICDWADGEKHKHKRERQAIAAQNAVQFTIHVLERGGFVSDTASVKRSKSSAKSASQPSRLLFVDKRDQTMVELNRLLSQTQRKFGSLTSLAKPQEEQSKIKILEAARESREALSNYFDEHRIYLSENLCAKLERFNQVLDGAWSDFRLAIDQNYPHDAEACARLNRGFARVTEKIPALRRDIEQELRAQLAGSSRYQQMLPSQTTVTESRLTPDEERLLQAVYNETLNDLQRGRACMNGAMTDSLGLDRHSYYDKVKKLINQGFLVDVTVPSANYEYYHVRLTQRGRAYCEAMD